MTGNRKQTVRPYNFTTKLVQWERNALWRYLMLWLVAMVTVVSVEVFVSQILGIPCCSALVDMGRNISVYHFYWDIYLARSTVQTHCAFFAFNPTVCHIEVEIDWAATLSHCRTVKTLLDFKHTFVPWSIWYVLPMVTTPYRKVSRLERFYCIWKRSHDSLSCRLATVENATQRVLNFTKYVQSLITG